MNLIKTTVALAFFALSGVHISAQVVVPKDLKPIMNKHTCSTCHAPAQKITGPSWKDIAKKNYTFDKFAALVAKPQPKNWPGYVPMQGLNVPKEDLKKIYDWVVTLK